jgi:hypothetical protein
MELAMDQCRALPAFILTGLMFLAAICSAAEPTTITVDGAIVTVAPGWVRSTAENSLILTPPNLPAGVGCTFTLLGGETFEGSLRERLDSEWKDVAKLGSVESDDMGKIDGEGKRVQIAGRSGVIQLKPDVQVYVWLVVICANHRIERMIYVTTNREIFAKYAAAVTTMINGTRYVAPKPLKPLTGVCLGFAQVKTSTQFECWIFLPDGVAYTGFPIGGPADLNVDTQRKIRNGQFGEYKIDGKEVLVTMKGKTEPIRFSPAKNTWTAAVTRPFTDRSSGIHGNTVATWTDDVPTTLRITAADPCDDLKLSATYRLDALEMSFKPKPIPSIKFTAGGEFSDDGLVHFIDPGTLKEGGGTVPSAMPTDGGRGKYTIGKNTLNLTYQDGTKLSLTFFVTAEELAQSTPRVLFAHRSKLLLVP